MLVLYIGVGLVALAVMIFLFLTLPGRSTKEQRAPFWGLNVAHRGLHSGNASIPENSLAAFEAASQKGYGIEMDLCLSSDGKVIVFHDNTLERICGREGRIEDLTYEQIKELRLFGSEHMVPTFEQMLSTVNGRSPLVIEIKPAYAKNRQLCEAVWELLKDYTGDYCIESFDPRIGRWFKKHHPHVLRGQLAFAPKGLYNRLYGGLFLNFMSRPHFIAYDMNKKPLSVKFVELFAMKVTWTTHPKVDIKAIESKSDMVIFELYEPKVKYK